MHAGGILNLAGTLRGKPVSSYTGYWYVNGTGDVGWIEGNGIYHAPMAMPSPSTVRVGYYWSGLSVETTATVVNPVPQITSVNVSSIYKLSTPIVVGGNGFLPGSVILVQGKPMATTRYASGQLGANAVLDAPVTGPVAIAVQNPDPGGSVSAAFNIQSAFGVSGVTPQSPVIHAGQTLQLSVKANGVTPPNGYWYLNGTGDVGYVDAAFLYHAPRLMPAPNQVHIGYYWSGNSLETVATVVNPVPVVNSISVSSFTQLSTPIAINGSGFLPSTVIYVQGRPMPTKYLSDTWISTTAVLAGPVSGPVAVVVQNPDPGASSAALTVPGVFPGVLSISPSQVNTGWVTLQLTGTGYTTNSVVLMDGRPMKATLNSPTSLTAVGYLPSWRGASTTTISLLPQSGAPASGSTALPVIAPALSYDAAARFTTQAAFGPRPGLVEHIQQVGFQGFLNEQMTQPGVTYPPNLLPRYPFLQAVASGNSLLRLRVATALSSYIVNQANSQEFQSYASWETKLEADALGNYRQLMTDIVSDAGLTNLLNLPGNHASTDPTYHPNQNFSREMMQLFTLGTAMLNNDGTIQRSANGEVVPSYDQNTILDLSRAFTGWDFGPVVNPAYTAYNIDFSQKLAGNDAYHDHGAKTLFGTVHLPAGQDIVTDRNAALDAIFNHPNMPPFVATRLIGQLVTSNPSSAYVGRVAAVFKDNGKGVRGDLAAIVTAILLDPEARAGDTADVAAGEGFLQDPLLFQAFAMNAVGQTQWDGQVIYMPGHLGEDFWHAPSVFGFYPAAAYIPGTTINSPQFSLLNNLTQIHRSQYLYDIVNGSGTLGFGGGYQANSWLFTAFTNLPDLVDALNHQLFHGRMPPATQTAIVNYCSGVSDPHQAFVDAIFLAMNSDSYNVTH